MGLKIRLEVGLELLPARRVRLPVLFSAIRILVLDLPNPCAASSILAGGHQSNQLFTSDTKI
jgi:hypothetical protein